MNDLTEYQQFASACVRRAGATVMDFFAKGVSATRKENQSSVVTQADLAAEGYLAAAIHERFPAHGIIAEESGRQAGNQDLTWIIDPLDGTSNFAAGLPWFGVMLALFQGAQPVVGAMYLPAADSLYTATRGAGAFRDGQPIRVTAETDLRNLLVAYSLDAASDDAEAEVQSSGLARLARRARNTRSTNCLLDVCYTADGRLGGCINHSAKIWDIAPTGLLLEEAGGQLVDFRGEKIRFDCTAEGFGRDYQFLGGSRAVLPDLIEVMRSRDSGSAA